MQTILVTGGAGFIGSNVCDRLLAQGKSVICLDNLSMYYSPERKIRNIEHGFGNKNFKFVVLDIRNKEELEQVFINNKIDKIIHLAARAGIRPSIEKPFWYYETNVLGTVNLLELSRKYKIKNFLFASSSSVYGANKKTPFSEDDKVDRPISPYAASKRACEMFCYTYSYIYKVPITCLRFFTVYGPRGRPDMAPYKFTKLISEEKPITMFGDGKSKRDYTFITDIVDGVVSALEKNFSFEIINLGNSEPVELRHFINIIENAIGKKAIIKRAPMPKGDVPVTYADITKARKLLNYKPKIRIEEGIQRFVGWFEQNG